MLSDVHDRAVRGVDKRQGAVHAEETARLASPRAASVPPSARASRPALGSPLSRPIMDVAMPTGTQMTHRAHGSPRRGWQRLSCQTPARGTHSEAGSPASPEEAPHPCPGSARPAAQPGGEQGGERPEARGHTQQRARWAPSLTKPPSHTDARHLHRGTGPPGGGPAFRSPRWKCLQGAWSWPRLGSRMETPHDPPRPGCPWEHLPRTRREAAEQPSGPEPGPRSPPAPHRASAEPTSAGQPARRTAPGGSRRWCWPAACRTSLEGEGQRSACRQDRATPQVCTQDCEAPHLVVWGPGGVLKLRCYIK